MSEDSRSERTDLARTGFGEIVRRSAPLVTRGLDDLSRITANAEAIRSAHLGDIFAAAKAGHVRMVWAILQAFPEKSNARGARQGETPLHVAARRGHVVVSELLLAHGAGLDVTTTEKCGTPLHWAARGGHTSMIRLLLMRGASLRAQDARGETPLHWAARWGHIDAVEFLLNSGAEPSANAEGGGAPLHWAARWGHTPVVRVLLSKHAEVDAKTRQDQTPLHLAVGYDHSDVVELLLAHGAQVNAICTRGRGTRVAPLDYARGEEVRRLLLAHGGIALRSPNSDSRTDKPKKGE